MIYLLADPLLIFLHLPEPSYESVRAFSLRLSIWNKLLRDYDIRLSMTKACRVAIGKTLQTSFNKQALSELCQRYNLPTSSNEIMNAASPFINSLLIEEDLDALLSRVSLPPERYHEAPNEKLHPKNYYERLESSYLQEAFYEMLQQVAKVRLNSSAVPKEFENIAVLTIFEGQSAWVNEHLEQIFVIVGWDLSVDPPVKRVVEALPVMNADKPDEAQLKAYPRIEYRSPLHALEEAVKIYPDKLNLAQQGRKKAKQSNFDEPQKIYEYILGLVEIWLPAFRELGADKANLIYLAQFGCEIANSYGHPTLNNPDLMRQFAVTVDDSLAPAHAVRHIKLSDDGGEYRIHFQEYVKANREDALVIGWVGRHPRTASEI